MAGRGRLPPAHARYPLSDPGVVTGQFGPGFRPHVPHPLDHIPPSVLLEERIGVQDAEMHRLAIENQRLAATHAALRQDLAGAQHEIQRMQAHMVAIQNDREQQVRALMDKLAKMEADLKASESLKVELQQARENAQNLMSIRQELTAQVQEINIELQRSHAEIQQVPAMHAEIERMRQEVKRAWGTYEYEKAANTEKVQQNQTMEKNYISMAREVERLRAELASVDKRGTAGAYGAGYKDPDPRGSNMYGDGYGISPMGAGAGRDAVYSVGPTSGRVGYDMPQRGGPQMPIPPVNGAAYGTGHTPPGRGGYDVSRSGSAHVRR